MFRPVRLGRTNPAYDCARSIKHYPNDIAHSTTKFRMFSNTAVEFNSFLLHVPADVFPVMGCSHRLTVLHHSGRCRPHFPLYSSLSGPIVTSLSNGDRSSINLWALHQTVFLANGFDSVRLQQLSFKLYPFTSRPCQRLPFTRMTVLLRQVGAPVRMHSTLSWQGSELSVKSRSNSTDAFPDHDSELPCSLPTMKRPAVESVFSSL